MHFAEPWAHDCSGAIWADPPRGAQLQSRLPKRPSIPPAAPLQSVPSPSKPPPPRMLPRSGRARWMRSKIQTPPPTPSRWLPTPGDTARTHLADGRAGPPTKWKSSALAAPSTQPQGRVPSDRPAALGTAFAENELPAPASQGTPQVDRSGSWQARGRSVNGSRHREDEGAPEVCLNHIDTGWRRCSGEYPAGSQSVQRSGPPST